MGPKSKAASLARWQSDSEFQGALLEELQWIRHKLNDTAGNDALEKESLGQRIDKVEERVYDLERAAGS